MSLAFSAFHHIPHHCFFIFLLSLRMHRAGASRGDPFFTAPS